MEAKHDIVRLASLREIEEVLIIISCIDMETITHFVRECKRAKQLRKRLLFCAHLKGKHDEVFSLLFVRQL